MRSTLNFEYEGKEYTLAFNNEVVRQLDRSGLLARIMRGELPITMTEELFKAAFEANHSKVSQRTRSEIYQQFSDTSEDGSLFEALTDMIAEVRDAMNPAGNITWKVKRG